MVLSRIRNCAVRPFRSYFDREWTLEILQNVKDLPPNIRNHLERFYVTTFWALASSGFGFRVSLSTIDAVDIAPFVYCISVIWYCLVEPWRENKRIFLFIVAVFSGSVTIGPWLSRFLAVDLIVITCVVLAITLAFGIFWAAHVCTTRFDLLAFSRLFLIEPELLLYLLVSSIVAACASTFGKWQMCALILWFIIYVGVYARELVLKIQKGDIDYVQYAIKFFTGLPAVGFHSIRLVFREVGTCRAWRGGQVPNPR